MDSIFQWLSQYGLIGVLIGFVVAWPIFFALMVIVGKLSTQSQVDTTTPPKRVDQPMSAQSNLVADA